MSGLKRKGWKNSMDRKYLYKIGIGYACVPLEFHKVEARNMEEARSIAIRKFLHPDKGYDHIEVKRIKKK